MTRGNINWGCDQFGRRGKSPTFCNYTAHQLICRGDIVGQCARRIFLIALTTITVALTPVTQASKGKCDDSSRTYQGGLRGLWSR